MPAKRVSGHRIAKSDLTKVQRVFLETFADTANVRLACRVAGIGARSTVYDWRKTNAAFDALWVLAEEDANDLIREEIWRRGMTGWDEIETITTDDGTRSKVVHKYDAGLLVRLAQARIPEYKARVDVTIEDTARGQIDAILNDPAAAAIACSLIEHLAGYSVNASGVGVDRE